MKNILIAFTLCLTLLFSAKTYALDPKLQLIGKMAGYGVAGGALLGTATLAFGSNGRAIAKGASLGLYAGIIFGSYVILNYELKKRGYTNEQDQNQDYYPEGSSPYEDEQTNKLINIEDYRLAQFDKKKDPMLDPVFFMNFVNLEF